MYGDIFHIDRYSSNLSKTYRIWHFKCFKNRPFHDSETCLLLVVPIISERLMGIAKTRYGICLQCDKASHLGKKLLLPGLLDGMLYKLHMQDLQKNDC